MKKAEIFKKATAAGIMIGIGATVNLGSENRIIGAVPFCVGLFSICTFGLNLFTGKTGYIFEQKNYLELSIIWLGNLFGSFICAFPMRIIKPSLAAAAVDMVNAKFSQNIISLFILSFFCGILVYIAVENFRNGKNEFAKVVGLFICVVAFIMCGFEHSIADMCYCIFAINDLAMLGKSAVLIITATVGNAFGSIVFRWMSKSGQ